MVSFGNFPVQIIITLIGMSCSSAQSCSMDLQATPSISSFLTSPNYPSNYPPSTSCYWTITAPTGYVVELTFLVFDTEGSINYRNNGCSRDYSDHLDIYDGNQESSRLLGRYCASYLPPNVYSSSTSLLLKFQSDKYTEKTGFKLKYTAVVPKPDPTICSPFNTFAQNNNIKYTGSSGYITSPLYGTKYPSNMQCTWVITAPKDHKIKLTFSDFSVGQYFYICSERHDFVEIRDGQSSSSDYIESLCSSKKPDPVYSEGRYMWIRFASNTDNYLDGNRMTNGFRAKYEAELSDSIRAIIGVIVATVVVVALIVACICIKRRRSPGHVYRSQPAAQTTLSYNQNPGNTTIHYPRQMQGGSALPSVRYSPVPQSTFPPHSRGYPPAPQGSHPPPSSGYPPAPQGSHPPPSSEYLPAPQGSHPPPSSGYPPASHSSYLQPPGATAGVGHAPQSSTTMKNSPEQTFLNDPPPDYPEQVPDVAPPPYPGIAQNPPHAP